MAAIKDWSNKHGLGELPRGNLYARVQAGLKNTFGLSDHSTPKQAFTLSDLAHIRSLMNPASFFDARDWSMLTLAFFALLRIGEYCGGGLRMRDVQLHFWGVQITIPFSKTSTHPAQVKVAARGEDDLLCPAHALRLYLRFIHPAHLANPSCPLFLNHPLIESGVSAESFTKRIHAFAAALGRDPTQFAGHSLRRGGATALYLAGVPEAVIQQHGRWRSLAVRGYLETSERHQLAPTMALLNKSKGMFPVPSPPAQASMPLISEP